MRRDRAIGFIASNDASAPRTIDPELHQARYYGGRIAPTHAKALGRAVGVDVATVRKVLCADRDAGLFVRVVESPRRSLPTRSGRSAA